MRATALHKAQDLSARLPEIRLRARHLARTLVLGDHGRRRSGVGGDFWQYRHAMTGDPGRAIDWRRSARSDQSFVRETESTFSRDALFHLDCEPSMDFASPAHDSKFDAQITIGFAAMISLLGAGERVGLSGLLNPTSGRHAEDRIADHITSAKENRVPVARPIGPVRKGMNCIVMSDFLGDLDALEMSVKQAAGIGVDGVLVQVLDPAEVSFGFRGRTVFEDMVGQIRHSTLDARGLRSDYLEALENRQNRLRELADVTGWQYFCHVTDRPLSHSFLRLAQSIGHAP